MPMAQALVMVRTTELEREPVMSPLRSPPSPQLDTSIITSTARKRKPDAPREAVGDDGKKLRQENGVEQPAGLRMSYGLAQPGPQLREAAPGQLQPSQQQQGAGAERDPHCGSHPLDLQQQLQHHLQQQQQHHHGHDPHHHGPAAEGEEGTIFSPVFHLTHKEGSEPPHGAVAAAAAAAGTPGPSGLATPAPTLCPAAPCRAPATEASALLVAAAEAVAPPRPHTPPPEAGAEYEPCSSALLSPLALPKPALQQQQPEPAAVAMAVAASPAACTMAAAAVAEESEEEYELEFDPLLFIKRLPPLEQCIPARRTSFLLPRQTRRSKRKTLVLDLDETLVHSTLDGFCRPDFTFPVEVGNVKHMVSVRQRPHLRTFLERVARLFEVVVFTASQRVYAEQLLNVIDPRRCLIRHRVYRESCVFWEGNYLKDLTVLGRDLRDTVIVDNSPQAFGFQIDNGIPIESWYDDDSDQELLRLLPFLETLAGAEDVRPHIQSQYKLRQMVDAALDPPRRCSGALGALFGAC